MSYPPTDDFAPARPTQAVLWLIALNVAVAFVQLTIQQDLPQHLGFTREDFGTGRLWTVATYMFVHGGFWHLALNMYALWAFGPRLERAWAPRALTWFYLWCGLGGVIAHAVFVGEGLLVGASAAVLGVLYAYARRWPDDQLLFLGVVPMKVRHLIGFLVAVNVLFGLLSLGASAQGGGGTAYLAHLGGLAFGWLWFRLPSGPNVERLRQRVASAPDLGDDPPRPVPKSFPRPRERGSESDEVVEKSKALTAKPAPVRPPVPTRPKAPPPVVAAAPISRTAALDRVLDKISAQGLDSLTPDERRILDEMSRTLRDG